MANNYKYLKEKAAQLKSELSLFDYFFKLEKINLVKYEGKIGKEQFFGFPDQKTGSISVNEQNLWFDHSSGRGGDIIEAVMYFEDKSFKEAIEVLSNESPVMISQPRITKFNSNPIEIVKVKNVEHPSLIQYLENRGIRMNDMMDVVREVHWRNKESKYFALGIQTDKGGYVLRSSIYKGTILAGGISTVKVGSKPERVKVFEGLFDFLTYTAYDKSSYWAIVLNSTANLTYALMFDIIERSLPVDLYMDRDLAGINKTDEFIDLAKLREFIKMKKINFELSPKTSRKGFTEICEKLKVSHLVSEIRSLDSTVFDQSKMYDGFKDLNQWHLSKLE